MRFNFFTRPSLLGLDIQPDAIRLVQLKKIKQRLRIERVIMQDLPGDVFAEGKVRRWDALQAILSEVVSCHRLRDLPVAASLPANLVRMQKMQIPVGMKASAIENEIRAVIQHAQPGFSEALCIDFTVMPQNNSGYSTVLFAATRKEYLCQYAELIDQSGLKLKIIDVECHALKRAVCFHAFFLDKPQAIRLLVHVMQEHVTLLVFDEHEIHFYQQWDGTNADDFSIRLNQNLQLFSATFPHLQIHQLIVCAGLRFDEISRIVNELPYPVHYHDMIPFLDYSAAGDAEYMKANGSDFLVALGLAMREMTPW